MIRPILLVTLTLISCLTINAQCNLQVNVYSNDLGCSSYNEHQIEYYAIATGGTPPYSFNWSDPVNTTNALILVVSDLGELTLTVTDSKGCQVEQTISTQFTRNWNVISWVEKTPVCDGCIDGEAHVLVSRGGVPPYTIQWFTRLNKRYPLHTGTVAKGILSDTYEIKITDSRGCYTWDTLEVGFLPELTPPDSCELTVDYEVNYMGCSRTGVAQIELYAHPSGGTEPYRYLWNDSWETRNDTVKWLEQGTYIAEITDAVGCKVIDTIVEETPLIDLSFEIIKPLSCATCSDAMVRCNVTSPLDGLFRFYWDDPNHQGGNLATGLAQGTYKVLVHHDNGCSNWAEVTIDFEVGIDDPNVQFDVSVYPNPSNGTITIESSAEIQEGRIINMIGEVVYSFVPKNGKTSLDLSHLTSGVYLVELNNAQGKSTRKLVIE